MTELVLNDQQVLLLQNVLGRRLVDNTKRAEDASDPAEIHAITRYAERIEEILELIDEATITAYKLYI